MTLGTKLRIAMLQLNVNQTELATRTNQTQANLSKKIINDNFKFSEYEKLIKALGCKLEINVILPSGEVI